MSIIPNGAPVLPVSALALGMLRIPERSGMVSPTGSVRMGKLRHRVLPAPPQQLGGSTPHPDTPSPHPTAQAAVAIPPQLLGDRGCARLGPGFAGTKQGHQSALLHAATARGQGRLCLSTEGTPHQSGRRWQHPARQQRAANPCCRELVARGPRVEMTWCGNGGAVQGREGAVWVQNPKYPH